MSERIPVGWSTIRIEKIGNFFGGLIGKTSNDFGHGHPFLTYMQVFSQKTSDKEGVNFVLINKGEKQNKVAFGDVLFTTSSETPNEIGMTSVFIEKDWSPYLNSFCFGLRPTIPSPLDPLFMKYVFRGDKFREDILPLAQGSTRFNLSKENLRKLSLLTPPLSEQKKIAFILNSVDEVIENTQSQIDKLQDLKKGTMNELLTQGIGHTEFKDSELGKIPKSWKVLDFQKIIQSSNQGVNTATEKVTYSAEGIKACRSNNIKENSFDWNNKKFVNKSTYARLTNKVKPKLNDVLYCNIGSNLGAATVVDTPEDFIITWNVLRITTENNKISPYFLSLSLNSLRKELMGFATESTMPFISSKALSKFKFRIPPLDEQKKISKVINGIGNNIDILKLKIHQTKSLKKSLMQDLLTGKVRVKVN